jgi:hypothetical protein
VNASTAADHREGKTAKKCDVRVPSYSEHACAFTSTSQKEDR